MGSSPTSATIYGPWVKRLRHRPFTAVTGVRFSYGSPEKSTRERAFFNYIRSFGTSYIRPSVELYCFAVIFVLRTSEGTNIISLFAQAKNITFAVRQTYHIERKAIYIISERREDTSSAAIGGDIIDLCNESCYNHKKEAVPMKENIFADISTDFFVQIIALVKDPKAKHEIKLTNRTLSSKRQRQVACQC